MSGETANGEVNSEVKIYTYYSFDCRLFGEIKI